MRTFEDDTLSDVELQEMLAAWTVPDPPARLRANVLAQKPARFGNQSRAAIVAFFLEAAAVALLVLTVGSETTKQVLDRAIPVTLTYLKPYPRAVERSAGGGGSDRSTLPAGRGEAPKFAQRHFLPPLAVVPNPHLPAVPTISAEALKLDAANYGDPLAALSGGFGNGNGSGVGGGKGDGYGPGSGGGSGGGIYSIGGDVSAPTLLSKVEPEYSEEARTAKYSGVVELSIVIDEHGAPRAIKVIRPLGMGLDEKAVQAVAKWRFHPAMKGGRPVSVTALVDVSFRLL